MKLANPNLLKSQNYIDGEWRDAAGTVEVRDPASGELLGSVADGSAADAEAAVAAASAAFLEWSRRTAGERRLQGRLRRTCWHVARGAPADGMGANDPSRNTDQGV